MSLNVICKSKLGDICDDTNFQLGYSILISAISLGRMCGPSIAGFLVFPAEQYPQMFSQNGVFGRYPILLPMLVLVTGLVITSVFMILYLPQDKKKGKGEAVPLIMSPKKVRNYNEYKGDKCMGKEASLECGDYENLNLELSIKDYERKRDLDGFQIVETMSLDDAAPRVSCGVRCCSLDRLKNSRIFRVLQTKECVVSCLLYGLYSFLSVGNNETFTLFSATAKDVNGLGFTTSEIGIALLVASGLLITFQFTFQSRVSIYFGSRKTLIISMLGLVFMFPLLPSIASITNIYLLWFVLCIWLFITRVLVALANLAINVLLKNSVTSDLLGLANGLGMTANSLGSMISPSVYGSIYAWSVTNIKGVGNSHSPLGFPCNQYFIFYLQSVWAVFVAVVAAGIPKHMERKKQRTSAKDGR